MRLDKLFLLNGSPRGGASASLKLAEAFIEGYCESREADLRRVDLATANIKACAGCYSCWRSDPGACVRKDDMDEFLPLYAKADLVLVSTPVYNYGMTSILKAFFERSVPLLYPYMVKQGELYAHPRRAMINPHRAFGLFATCGFPDADNFRPMRAHFEKLFGPSLAFEFLCSEGALLKIPELREVSVARLARRQGGGRRIRKDGRSVL